MRNRSTTMRRIKVLVHATCAAALPIVAGCADDPIAPPLPAAAPQALRVASTTFKEVAAGTYHTCAITAQDEAVCWGTNTNADSPWTLPWDNGAASTEGIRVGQIAAGHDTNCAIGQDNVPYGGHTVPAGLRCWGNGGSSVPGDVIPDVQQYSVGDHHACVIKTGGQLQCWAWIPADDFGDANFFGQATVPGGLGPVKQVSAGGSGSETSQQVPFFSSHTCVIRLDDTVFCWGDEGWDGVIITPPGDLGTVKQIEAGSMQTCAIKTDDTVACWGIFSAPPPAVGAVKQISSATGGDFILSGNAITCVIKTDDTVACWQWSDDDMAAAPTTIAVPGDLGAVQQISVGGHICALRMDGRIQCWNDNRFGFGALDVPDSTHVSFRPTAEMTVTADPAFRARAADGWGVQTGTSYTVSYSEGEVVTNADTISGEDAGLTYRFLFDYSTGDSFDTGYTSSSTITMTAPPAEASPGEVPIVEIYGFVKDASGDLAFPNGRGSSHYSFLFITPRFSPTAVFAAPGTVLTGAPFTLALSGAEVRTSVEQHDGTFVYDTISAAEAGIEYAFDCGDGAGYGDFSSQATANCDAGNVAGEQLVKGRVRDSDGDETAYEATVQVQESVPEPDRPSSFLAEFVSTGRIALSWTLESDNATRLELSRRVQTDGVWSAWEALSPPAASDVAAEDDGASAISLNKYQLRACNGSGCSGYVTSNAIIAELKPAAPTALVATVIGAGNIAMTWTDGSDNETGFEMSRRVKTDGVWSPWDALPAPAADDVTASDAGASRTGFNQYRLRSCNPAGCSRYASSSQVVAELMPAAPLTLDASVVGTGRIDLEWTVGSGQAQPFLIERRVRGGDGVWGTWLDFDTASADATSASDTTASATTSNQYRLRACAGPLCTRYETSVPVIAELVPAAPLTLDATVAGTGRIDLTWTVGSGPAHPFLIERRVRGGDGVWGTWLDFDTASADATSASDATASSTTSNQYRLRACAGPMCTRYKTSVRVIAELVPAAPLTFDATVAVTGRIDLAWTVGSGPAHPFQIERRVRGGDGVWGTWLDFDTVSADATSASDSTASATTANQYRIRACAGPLCTRTRQTRPTLAELIPSAPTSLQGIVVPDGIDLSWSDNSANEQYFEVWRQDPDSTAVVAAPAADATTFTDTFTDPESRYKYRVRACNARGCSAWSPTITVNTPGETL